MYRMPDMCGARDPATGFDAGQLFDPRTGPPLAGNIIPPSLRDPAGAAIRGLPMVRSGTANRSVARRAESSTTLCGDQRCPNDFTIPLMASSSQHDDAMIRNRSKRMTVVQLKQRMDRRFDSVDKRFDVVEKRFDAVDQRFADADKRFAAIDRGLISIGDKLDSITRRLDGDIRDHRRIFDEHEERLKDLEGGHRASQESAR